MLSDAELFRDIKNSTEFGSDWENTCRHFSRASRELFQDICYSYRGDPPALAQPYLDFVLKTEERVHSIVSSQSPPERREFCVAIVQSIIDFVPNQNPSFKSDYESLRASLVPDDSPLPYAAALRGPPNDALEAAAAQFAADTPTTKGRALQDAAIRYVAWSSAQVLANQAATLLKKGVPQAYTAKQKEILELRNGPLRKVEDELAQVERNIQIVREAKARKEATLEQLKEEAKRLSAEFNERRRRADAKVADARREREEIERERDELAIVPHKIEELLRPLASEFRWDE